MGEGIHEGKDMNNQKNTGRIRQSMLDFLELESAGGILLVIAAVIAMILANSPLENVYLRVLGTPMTVSIGQFGEFDFFDVLFVGDTLRTDIIGANTYGFDSTLVLSGNTLPETADLMIRASGIIPTYISESIAT